MSDGQQLDHKTHPNPAPHTHYFGEKVHLTVREIWYISPSPLLLPLPPAAPLPLPPATPQLPVFYLLTLTVGNLAITFHKL